MFDAGLQVDFLLSMLPFMCWMSGEIVMVDYVLYAAVEGHSGVCQYLLDL